MNIYCFTKRWLTKQTKSLFNTFYSKLQKDTVIKYVFLFILNNIRLLCQPVERT